MWAAGGGSEEAAVASSKPYVPAPPAQPITPADFLGLLRSCPRLVERILEVGDGLRTVTLVARDAANLCTALGARSSGDGAGTELWRALAASVPGSSKSANAPVAEALTAVRRAVRADAARSQRMTKTAAKSEWRMTDKDLQGLRYTTRCNPIFYRSAPTKMYNQLDVLAAAHRKHGSLQAIQAGAARARATANKKKATLAGGEEERREEMEEALEAVGLQMRTHQCKKMVKSFIKNGQGTAAGVAASIKGKIDSKAAQEERYRLMIKRLTDEGLRGESWGASLRQYYAGIGSGTLDAAVAEMKATKEVRETRDLRRTRITELLAAEGLSHYQSTAAVSQYIASGTGSEEAVLAACRVLHDAEQARTARRTRIEQLLAAEGMPASYIDILGTIRTFIYSGGSEEAAMQAARAHDVRMQRQEVVLAALAAEALPQDLRHTVAAVRSYVGRGEGSLEAVLVAAREQHQKDQQREERRAAVMALLEAEGLPIVYCNTVPLVRQFIRTGQGDQAACMAAARAKHQQDQQQGQRRSAVAELLATNGLPPHLLYSVADVARFIELGEGSEEAALEGAQSYFQQYGADLYDDYGYESDF